MAFVGPNVKVVIGGASLGGLSKDVFVSIAYDNPAVTVRETLDGDGIFSINRSRTATVTITCEVTSNAHNILSALFQAQKLTGGGQVPLVIADTNVPDSASLFASPSARVSQMPDVSYSGEGQTVDWVVLCTNCEHVMGAMPVL